MTHLKVNSTSNLFYSACEESIHLLELILSNMLATTCKCLVYRLIVVRQFDNQYSR